MAEPRKPQPFRCPRCNQKHRTAVSVFEENPTAILRATCTQCGLALAVTVPPEGLGGPDDPLVCRPSDEVPGAAAGAAPAAPTPAPAAPTRSSRRAGREGREGKRPPRPERTPRETPERKASDRPAASAGAGAAPSPAAPGAQPQPPATRPSAPAAGQGAAPPRTNAPPPRSATPPARPGAAPQRASAPPPTPGADPVAASISSPSLPPPTSPDPEAAEFVPGDHIGRYAVESAIGSGGTSQVYRAFDPTTNRTIAIKVLRLDAPETLRQRFLREIEVQANIRHQNIMPVFDRGTLPDGRPFFTMELLYEPITLETIVADRDRGALVRSPVLKALVEQERLLRDILLPVMEGIQIANVENGVVHRDLKPSNILVDKRTLRPYVIDFGICHVLERKGGTASAVIPPSTEDAGIVGTPRFLAPEQVAGTVHGRTDVWGLGALVRFCVTGEPPLEASTNTTRAELKRRIAGLEEARTAAQAAGDEKRVALCDEKLARMQDKNLRTIDDIYRDARDAKYTPLPSSTPSTLAALIHKAMAQSPGDRYVNARQLATDLSAYLGGQRVRALSEAGGKAAAAESARRAVRRHAGAAAFALGGLVLGGVVGMFIAQQPAALASSRVQDVEEDVNQLANELEPIRRSVDDRRLSPLGQRVIFEELESRAKKMEARLAGESESGRIRSLRERVAFVKGQFAPVRLALDMPAGASALLVSTLPAYPGRLTLQQGENAIAPGNYTLEISPGDVRVPLEVPLRIRAGTAEAQPDREPAWQALTLPMAPERVPADCVLVLGGRVRPRDLPFAEPSPEETVAPYLLAKTETTNASYAEFLQSLDTAARLEHKPSQGIDVAEDGTIQVAAGQGNRPVVGVRPTDAVAFAAWRTRRDGVAWRLPTEAEWAYAAGASLGYSLPGGVAGRKADADLVPPLAPAGANARDVAPCGALGLFGNAREIVVPLYGKAKAGETPTYLVKGAGVGDPPDQAAIHLQRRMNADERHNTTGFRLVRELSPGGPK